MPNITHISILNDFSDAPIGRVPEDGPDNGQRFRVEFLIPALENYKFLHIDLDGTEGYGSSFLEEAFGGLVRLHNYSSEELLKRLQFKSEEDNSYIIEIQQYINDATPRKK